MHNCASAWPVKIPATDVRSNENDARGSTVTDRLAA